MYTIKTYSSEAFGVLVGIEHSTDFGNARIILRQAPAGTYRRLFRDSDGVEWMDSLAVWGDTPTENVSLSPSQRKGLLRSLKMALK